MKVGSAFHVVEMQSSHHVLHKFTRISSYFETLVFLDGILYKTLEPKQLAVKNSCLTTNIFSLEMHLFSPSQGTS